MKKKRGMMLVALSLVMGLGAAWFANGWIANRAGITDANNAVVMSAAMDIPYGTKMESRHIKAVKMPKDLVPQDAVLSVEEIEGFVANADVVRGEMLIQSRFVAHDGGSTLALNDRFQRGQIENRSDLTGLQRFGQVIET